MKKKDDIVPHGIRHAKLLFPGGKRGERQRERLDATLAAADAVYNWAVDELRFASAMTAGSLAKWHTGGFVPPDMLSPLPSANDLSKRWTWEKKVGFAPAFPDLCQSALFTVFRRRVEPAMEKFYKGDNSFPRLVRPGGRLRSIKHESNSPGRLRISPTASGRRWKLKVGSVGTFRLGSRFPFDPDTDTVKEVTIRARAGGGYSAAIRLHSTAPPPYVSRSEGSEVIGIDVGGVIPIATSDPSLNMLRPDVRKLAAREKNAQLRMSAIRERALAAIKKTDPSLSEKEIHRRASAAVSRDEGYIRARGVFRRVKAKIENKFKHARQVAVNRIMSSAAVVVIQEDGVKDMLMKKDGTAAARRGRNRTTASAGMAASLRMIEEKAASRGVMVIRVSRNFPSSQICSACNSRIPAEEWKKINKRKDRVFSCPDCHAELDRDSNAAINIRNEGIRIMEDKPPLGERKATTRGGFPTPAVEARFPARSPSGGFSPETPTARKPPENTGEEGRL